jgi:hypothetical protein
MKVRRAGGRENEEGKIRRWRMRKRRRKARRGGEGR